MYLKALAIQPPYAATSSMPAQHLLLIGCWNTGEQGAAKGQENVQAQNLSMTYE